MSLKDCIGAAVAAGEMDAKRAATVVEEFEGMLPEFKRMMGPDAAEAEAARAVVAKVKREAFERRRITQLSEKARVRLAERMVDHETLTGKTDPAQFLLDVVAQRRGAKGETLEGKTEAVRRQARREMTEAIVEFRANLLGMRRNKENLLLSVRELFGQDTGNATAKAIAQGFSRAAETLRLRANAAGADIGKMDGWGLPQSHDRTKVAKAGFEEWRDFVLGKDRGAPRIDLDRMKNPATGMAHTEASIETALYEMFQAIRTDGYSRRQASARAGAAMYKRRNDARFMHFNGPDDWIEYSERFGSGQDAFRVMMGHLDGMSQEVAAMELFGPNPALNFEWLKDAAQRLAALGDDDGKALEKARSKARHAQSMMDLLTGVSNIPDNRRFARTSSAIRQYIASTMLGRAVISSLSDLNTQRLASYYAGIARTGPYKQLFRLMGSSDLRAEANTAGLIFENAVDVGNAAARFDLEEAHVEGAARLADFTLRSTGLSYLTEVQRQSFGLHLMNNAAKWARQPWEEISERSRRVLEQYGIDRAMWARISASDIHETTAGLSLLRPQEIEDAAGQRAADLYMEMVASQTQYAVPSVDMFSRALVLGGTKPGTVSGEGLRFMMQFKSFPVTIATQMIGRMIYEGSRGRLGMQGAGGLLAGLFIGNTMLGAMAIHLKDISKGKDPRDADTTDFWLSAMAQGGGVGIFGDFLFADQNRFGQSLGETIAGPTFSAANDIVLRFGVGNLQELAAGEDTNAGGELVNLLRRYTPGGSAWYASAAYEREVLDRLAAIADPNASRSARRRIKSAQRTGSGYFYEPGTGRLRQPAAPRLPDIERLMK